VSTITSVDDGREGNAVTDALLTGVRVKLCVAAEGDGVGVSVGSALPGKFGKTITPLLISTVLNKIAKTITAVNGNIHAITREKPVKGANDRFDCCCCAAAVKKADRPGLNPWGGGGASSRND